MSKRKQTLIKQFKYELRASLEYQKRINYLKERLELLEDKLSVHSPRLDGIPGTSKSHDERLAEYIEKKSKIEGELSLLNEQAAKVSAIVKLMDQEVANHLISVYRGDYSIEEAGVRMHLTRRQMRYLIDSEILKAYEKYQR